MCNQVSAAATAAKSLQSCPTLCDPIDGSQPGSPVPGILQARTLEWVAISFSNAWKWKVKVKSLSHVRLFATPWTTSYQVPPSMGFSRQEYWSGVPLPSPTKFLPSHKWKRFFKRNKQNHPYNISLSREAEALHYILLHEIFTSWQQALPFWRQAVTRDMAEARVTAANLNLTQRTSGRKVTQLIWNHHCMVKE